MSTTRRNTRREMYNQVPGLGFSGTADSLTGATLTDTNVFVDATIPQGHYRGMYLLRPDRTGDDLVHRIVSHNPTTGVVTTSNTYSNTTDTNYEIVGLIHPDELNACLARAMQRVFFETQTPMCGEITNGDFEASTGLTGWTSSNVGTYTISQSANHAFSGAYSMRCVSTATDQYASSVTVFVSPNEPFFASAVVRCISGTASFSVYDLTNGVVIASAVTTTEDIWENLYLVGSVPADCRKIELRLGGSENNVDLYWNHAMFYRTRQTQLPAPSWLNEQYKLLKVRECVYQAGNATNTHDATSRIFDDWLQPSMYSLDPFHNDLNPYMLEFQRHLPNHELWVAGKRPYSDLNAFDVDTTTTLAPERLLYAYARNELAMLLRRRYPSDQRWARMLEEAAAEVTAETQSRPETPQQPIRREEWIGWV